MPYRFLLALLLLNFIIIIVFILQHSSPKAIGQRFPQPNVILINFEDAQYPIKIGIRPTVLCDGLVTIIVPSLASRPELRDWARQTWANDSSTYGIAVVFVLSGYEQDQSASLEKENDMYGNLLVTDAPESYYNLTLKIVVALSWFDRQCSSKFVLKADADTLVSMENLQQFVGSHWRSENAFHCHVHRGIEPIRQTGHKWFTAEEQFNGTQFPDCCSGPGYLMTNDVVGKLLSQLPNHTYMPTEDVFLTGILAQTANVTRRDDIGRPYERLNCLSSKEHLVFTHPDHSHEVEKLRQLWSQYLELRHKNCSV